MHSLHELTPVCIDEKYCRCTTVHDHVLIRIVQDIVNSNQIMVTPGSDIYDVLQSWNTSEPGVLSGGTSGSMDTVCTASQYMHKTTVCYMCL